MTKRTATQIVNQYLNKMWLNGHPRDIFLPRKLYAKFVSELEALQRKNPSAAVLCYDLLACDVALFFRGHRILQKIVQ